MASWVRTMTHQFLAALFGCARDPAFRTRADRSTYQFLAALCGCALVAASAAQSLPESPPRPPTELESAGERLDAALRDRALVGDDARARFIDAQFARTDPEALVRGLAAAFAREPREMLYLASLASACMERTLPVRPECAATDYLAQWSFRDGDNALPWLLLAERARRRNDLATMTAHVNRAAQQPRFDDYWSRRLAAYWKELEPLARPEERGAAAMLARLHAASWPVFVDGPIVALCRTGRMAADEALRASCDSVAKTMAQRGSTFMARRIGIGLMGRAVAANAKGAARDAETLQGQLLVRCSDFEAQISRGLESADPRERARAIELAVAIVVDGIATDETTACERQVERLSRTK